MAQQGGRPPFNLKKFLNKPVESCDVEFPDFPGIPKENEYIWIDTLDANYDDMIDKFSRLNTMEWTGSRDPIPKKQFLDAYKGRALKNQPVSLTEAQKIMEGRIKPGEAAKSVEFRDKEYIYVLLESPTKVREYIDKGQPMWTPRVLSLKQLAARRDYLFKVAFAKAANDRMMKQAARKNQIVSSEELYQLPPEIDFDYVHYRRLTEPVDVVKLVRKTQANKPQGYSQNLHPDFWWDFLGAGVDGRTRSYYMTFEIIDLGKRCVVVEIDHWGNAVEIKLVCNRDHWDHGKMACAVFPALYNIACSHLSEAESQFPPESLDLKLVNLLHAKVRLRKSICNDYLIEEIRKFPHKRRDHQKEAKTTMIPVQMKNGIMLRETELLRRMKAYSVSVNAYNQPKAGPSGSGRGRGNQMYP